jgi:glutaredoxin
VKPIEVTIYTREGCTLCREAYFLLKRIGEEYPIQLTLFDISTDPEIEMRYTWEIPVVAINGEVAFVSEIDERALREKLTAML